MDRRSFMTAAAAGLALLSLPGCGGGSSSESSGVFSGTESPVTTGQQISGRIAPELVFSGAQVGSAYGPSALTGDMFTSSISPRTVGLLALGDNSGGVRGFTLTFPGESPVFSAENSALAIIFMEPGFLRLDPGEAREQIERIRASSAFAPFAQILLANAGSRLDLLSGDSNYINAREALTQSLGNPFPAAPPTGQAVGKAIGTISNPSPRFLRVVRDGQQVPELLAPYGTLTDQPLTGNYVFYGLGEASSLPDDTALVEETYFPTLVFAIFIPWLELAVGQKVPVQLGLELVQRLRAPSFNPRVALVNTTTLATVLSQDSGLTLGEMAEAITEVFDALTKLITGGGYVAGLAFVIGSILKFKQHKDNPTQFPIGTPLAMALISAALLLLPAILNRLGNTMFDDPAGAPPQPF